MPEIIKKYTTDDEKIIIEKDPNGKYFVEFGYMEDIGRGGCHAGGYLTVEEAEKVVKRCRAKAREI